MGKQFCVYLQFPFFLPFDPVEDHLCPATRARIMKAGSLVNGSLHVECSAAQLYLPTF